jgi:hypothetical protein
MGGPECLAGSAHYRHSGLIIARPPFELGENREPIFWNLSHVTIKHGRSTARNKQGRQDFMSRRGQPV